MKGQLLLSNITIRPCNHLMLSFIGHCLLNLITSLTPRYIIVEHWDLTMHVVAVKIKMTGVALFWTILSDNSCMKVRCQKVFIYLSAILMDFIFFVFPLDYICSDSVLVPFLCFCTRMQSACDVRWIQRKVWLFKQSNFKQLTNCL